MKPTEDQGARKPARWVEAGSQEKPAEGQKKTAGAGAGNSVRGQEARKRRVQERWEARKPAEDQGARKPARCRVARKSEPAEGQITSRCQGAGN